MHSRDLLDLKDIQNVFVYKKTPQGTFESKDWRSIQSY